MTISKKQITLAIAILIIAALGYAGYVYLKSTESVNPPSPPGDREINEGYYRNEEHGFEFEYPEGWTFHENTFRSPFSKFNLVGASPKEDGNPNPILPSVLINIVTKEFAINAASDRERLGATVTNISVAGIESLKYEYVEHTDKISVDVPLPGSTFILGSTKQYEEVLNQIIDSFKFIK